MPWIIHFESCFVWGNMTYISCYIRILIHMRAFLGTHDCLRNYYNTWPVPWFSGSEFELQVATQNYSEQITQLSVLVQSEIKPLKEMMVGFSLFHLLHANSILYVYCFSVEFNCNIFVYKWYSEWNYEKFMWKYYYFFEIELILCAKSWEFFL